MLKLEDLTSDLLNGSTRDELIRHLIDSVSLGERLCREVTRLREFEGDCLNVLSEFAPWQGQTKEGKVLNALLEAVDKVGDRREEEGP